MVRVAALAWDHASVARRRASPASWTRRIAEATFCGSVLVQVNPLIPSTINSAAALSGWRKTTLGTPSAAASATTSPYPSRRERRRET